MQHPHNYYLPFYCATTHGFHPSFTIQIFHPAGTPDPPNDLGYNDRVVIESSVDLQWTRPTYTGGVAVVNYTVSSTSGGTVTVEDTSEDVKYSPGLVYGDVQVSAINTCSQGSQPTAINIPAKGDCVVKSHCSNKHECQENFCDSHPSTEKGFKRINTQRNV